MMRAEQKPKTRPKVKKILISQPQPADIEKSPFKKLISQYRCDLTFFKFFDIVGLSATEFRQSRIHIEDFTAVIFNSKHSVDHFFRLAKALRVNVPESMKYFCTTEQIAYYLQTYIQYRKRKIFFGQQTFADLIEIMDKHRDENFIFPCSDEKQTEYIKMLDRAKYKYTRAVMYTSQPRDLKKFNLKDFDIIALFSPIGVRSLLKSFPDVKDMGLTIAAFGASTHAALEAAGIKLSIAAPTKSAPSMAMAIENYMLGKAPEEVIVPKVPTTAKKSSPASSKTISSSTGITKKVKSVIADKTKYRQMQEERKAKAAARRAERAAAKLAATAKPEVPEVKPKQPKATPAKTAPVKTAPVKAAPVKATPAKATPVKAKPAKTAAKTTAKATAKTTAKKPTVKTAPAKPAAKKSAPAKVKAKTAPAKTTAKASPVKATAKASPAKAVSSKVKTATAKTAKASTNKNKAASKSHAKAK